MAADTALSNVKVLDLTHYVAGPYCTKLLADYGADVIKVERPGSGDGARSLGPFPEDIPHPDRSGMFLYLNTNKRGITLDLKTPSGVKIIKELVKDADILVENYAPGVMDRLGLGYDILDEINPGLTMVSISNFGQTGPYRDFKASDIVMYGMGGILYLSGAYEREPLHHGLTQAGYWGGEMGALAALTGLYYRRETGIGQQADVSIQEAFGEGQLIRTANYSFLGAVLRRQPKGGGGIGEDVMPCADGYVAPMLGGHSDWHTFAVFMDIPELMEERFVNASTRVVHGEELNERLRSKFSTQNKMDILNNAQEWGFPFGVAQTTEDLDNCPQLASRDFFVEIECPGYGTLKVPGAPFKMTETPFSLRRDAPKLGEHNDEVYREKLGIGPKEMVILRERGVI